MDHRYSVLKKHLSELGYNQPLVIEAVPLVEKLLGDLVKTTESLFHYKNVAQSAMEERDILQLGAEPYKCDNAKLVKECNDLHLAFLQFREQTDKLHRDLKYRIHRLEGENEDLSDTIMKLKKSGDVKSTKFISKKKEPVTKTTEMPPKASKNKSTKSKSEKGVETGPDDDMNKGISQLIKEVNTLKTDLQKQYELCESFRKKVESRDKEIGRLSSMLEGGRPVGALNKDCCYKDVSTKVTKANTESLILTKEKMELEIQLAEAISKQHEAMKRALQLADRNKELERELRDIDQMALAVEAECNTTVKQNINKMHQIQDQLEKCQCQINQFEREIAELQHSKHILQIELKTIRDEKESMNMLLENALDDKKRLTDRMNQFTRIEHDLNLEIDRLVQTTTMQKRRITELEMQVNNNEKRMEHESEKSDSFRKTRLEYGDVNTKSIDTNRKLSERDDTIKRLEKENQELIREKHNLMSQLESLKETNNCAANVSAKGTLSRLEKERDLARDDIKRLEEERNSLRKRLLNAQDLHNSERDRLQKLVQTAEEKLRTLDTERRELITVQGSRRAAINNLEEEIETLNSQLRTTQSELQHVHTMYTQVKTLQEQTDSALADVQNQLTQIENDYSRSQNRIRDMEKERSELENELSKSMNDTHSLRGSLNKIDVERENLLVEVDSKTERIAALEHELKLKDNKLLTLEAQEAELKRKLNAFSEDTEKKDYLMKNTNSELTTLRRELEDCKKTVHLVNSENKRLQDDLSKAQLNLRSINSDLDRAMRENADLKTQLQQYVYEIKRVEDIMSKKENERSEMLEQFRSLSHEATILETSNHTLETQAFEARTELKTAQDQITDYKNKIEQLDILNHDYEKQLMQLTSQIASLETQLRHNSISYSKNEANLASMKDLCVKLDEQKEKLIRETKAKDEMKTRLEQEKEMLFDDIKKLKQTLEKDRDNINSLESLLVTSRQETVEQQLLNQELQREIQRLKDMVEELQHKFSSTTQQLGVFQEKALDYSQQLKQLRREIANERFHSHYSSGELSNRYPSL